MSQIVSKEHVTQPFVVVIIQSWCPLSRPITGVTWRMSPVVSGVHVTQSWVFCVVFSRPLFLLLFFIVWSMVCLSVFIVWSMVCLSVFIVFWYLWFSIWYQQTFLKGSCTRSDKTSSHWHRVWVSVIWESNVLLFQTEHLSWYLHPLRLYQLSKWGHGYNT